MDNLDNRNDTQLIPIATPTPTQVHVKQLLVPVLKKTSTDINATISPIVSECYNDKRQIILSAEDMSSEQKLEALRKNSDAQFLWNLFCRAVELFIEVFAAA